MDENTIVDFDRQNMDMDIRLRPVVEAVETLRLRRGPVVLAMDGMAAAGKSTAADALARRWNAPVVRMDDFYLPLALRTPQRLAEPGGNVHYERFAAEVLPHLRTGEAFSYRPFDCSVMELRGEKRIAAAGVILVEGAYAMHPRFGAYADLTIFCGISPEEQERRIRRRNGPDKWEDFRTRWIPLENAYHAAFHTRDRADIRL